MNKITLAQLKEQQQISSLDEYENMDLHHAEDVEKKSVDLLDGWVDDVIRNEI